MARERASLSKTETAALLEKVRVKSKDQTFSPIEHRAAS